MLKISWMKKSDINEAIELWYKNHSVYCDDSLMPDFLPGGKQKMEEYFSKRIDNENAIILKEENNILGFFSWVSAPFHNEKSAFCPIIGHYAKEDDKENIYTQLYNYISKEWIKNDIFNHLWMINCKDNFLKNFTYDLGFGSYVADAFIKKATIEKQNSQYEITLAKKKDCELLYNLVEESRRYYLSAPIFLKREVITKDEILKIIENSAVFLAWDNNKPFGFINVSKNNDYDIEQLLTPEGASIDRLGAYINSDYRSKGIGKSLLNKVFEYCDDNAIDYVHVDFETSNTYANKFWRNYFTPVILSVRRTINKDANL
jgi:ribosomal protein S18 acetylase RimI-like enzyme